VMLPLYAGLGLLMPLLCSRLGAAIEPPPLHQTVGRLGLGRSRSAVLRLSALFSLDAFAGGPVPLSILAFWFHTRWAVEPAILGAIFFGANILAAVSALSAARLARRYGLINTMVFTH